jgi:hypothetical protein
MYGKTPEDTLSPSTHCDAQSHRRVASKQPVLVNALIRFMADPANPALLQEGDKEASLR